MDNIQIIDITEPDGSISQAVIIDRGNNEFTSMSKTNYDAQQAAQAQPQG